MDESRRRAARLLVSANFGPAAISGAIAGAARALRRSAPDGTALLADGGLCEGQGGHSCARSDPKGDTRCAAAVPERNIGFY